MPGKGTPAREPSARGTPAKEIQLNIPEKPTKEEIAEKERQEAKKKIEMERKKMRDDI